MPKFINDFKNKLIEHANSSGLNSNNTGIMGTPIIVNPVTEHADRKSFTDINAIQLTKDPSALLSFGDKDYTVPDFRTTLNNLDDANLQGIQATLTGILDETTIIEADVKTRLLDFIQTVRVSGIYSYIILTPLTDTVYGNSYFSIKANLIQTADDNITLDDFDKNQNIYWVQDDSDIPISTTDSTYTFKAPTNRAGSTITTTILCVYNGAVAEINITVEPNQQFTSEINSSKLTSSLENKLTDITKSAPQNASDTMLNVLPTLTANQSKSIIIPVPTSLKTLFTSNSKYRGVSPTEDIYLATTKNLNGIETLDLSELPSRTDSYNLVLPSLLPNSNINMLLSDGTTLKVYRDNSNKISFNGTTYNPIPASITVNNKKLTLNGIGSPAVFNVSTPRPPPSPTPRPPPPPPPSNNPSSILDYIFYFAYPVAFSGAIFYGFVSLISVDPVSVILNRNWSVFFNIYIGVCAIISIFVWFKKQNPVIPKTIFNQYSVKSKN